MGNEAWTNWFASVVKLLNQVPKSAFPAGSGLASPVGNPNPQVDEIFSQWDKPDSPGFALAVSQGGNIVYTRGYGMADLDHDVPITPSTVFHACSLAKQFTAMSIMLLVGQNKLQLNDYVRTYVPQLPAALPPVTIAQLLHHISGIRDQWVLTTLAGWRLSDDTIKREDVVQDLVPRMETLNFAPGSDWSYSNTNYTLAGEIVRNVSGQSLAQFAHDQIFVPLGMTSTKFVETHGEIVKNRAYGYWSAYPAFATRMPNYDLTGPTNLLTTVEDLIRWNRNFDLLTVGGSSALAAMQTTVPITTDLGYGFGLFLGPDDQGRNTVWHDGRDPGHRSHFIRYPDQHLAVALLGNVQLPNSIYTGDLVASVAAVFLNSAAPIAAAATAQPVQASLSPGNLNQYLGKYHSKELGVIYEVVMDGSSSIAIARRKYGLAPLTPTSHSHEFTTNLSVVLAVATVTFGSDAHGNINGFDINDTSGADRLRNFHFDKI
jgi:CubicO group peptidase (beta-lactamase class C family)